MKIRYSRTLNEGMVVNRRDFFKIGGVAGAGLLLTSMPARAQEKQAVEPAKRPETNVGDALKVPKSKYSLPGLFPGRVVQVHDPEVWLNDRLQPKRVQAMLERAISNLTGRSLKKSFAIFFDKADVVGIKVNPAGGGLISSRGELVWAIIAWLIKYGIQPQNIIIWDRFDYMLRDAGFTSERFPEIGLEGMQTMDEEAAEGKTQDNSRWLDKDGNHVSAANFDRQVYYWADVEGPQDLAYLNQHVFNGKFSYFGKLLTQKLTKIVNVAVFKNSGNGISMATKNLGYGAICNTNRLHKPLFFDVCTEVLAFPVIRDKLVLNVTDGLRAQYEGGPGPAAQFAYNFSTIFTATDPFALDMTCHNQMVQKRKSMGIQVNAHPKYTDYLRYGERLGLGIVDPARVQVIRA